MDRAEKLQECDEVDQAEYIKAQHNLNAFFRLSWDVLEPGKELLQNWHQTIICEYLTACYKRQIKRLIINIPPRYTKSILASIAFPSWCWIQDPTLRFLFASYSASLSTKHSVDRRRLIQSPWYQQGWGHLYKMAGDQNVKNEFQNTKRGHMIATSMGGTATGKGGNFIIIDDAHDATRAESDIERQNTLDDFDLKFTTRLDDKKEGVIVVIMQRLHEEDLTGHLLAQEGWEHLKIQGQAEKPKTYIFPISKKKLKVKEGQILHPDREGQKELDAQKKALGAYGYSGQYQQEPSPREGGLIRRKFWRYYSTLPKKWDEQVQSWDLTFKDSEAGDYVVGQVWGRVGVSKYLLYTFRNKINFPKTMAAILRTRKMFPQARRILIEDAANGAAVVAVLKKKISGVIAVPASRSKVERFVSIEPDFESMNYYIPVPGMCSWADEFVEECAKFDRGAHDDQVDAFTQVGNYFIEKEDRGIAKLTVM